MPKGQTSGDRLGRYGAIMEQVFFRHYRRGMKSFYFTSDEYALAASELGIPQPRNCPDIIYTFRSSRRPLPESIRSTAPAGRQWVIRLAGTGRYEFALAPPSSVVPNPDLAYTKVPDATPAVIAMYALNDEQALLARIRYNRLVDLFSGAVCYSLQNHLRTSVPGMGQIEVDELYVGVDRSGAHYIFPVEAKASHETLGLHQIEQGVELCRLRFPGLICRPMAAQFMNDGVVVLFEFEQQEGRLRIRSERHYRLVAPDAISPDELASYRALA